MRLLLVCTSLAIVVVDGVSIDRLDAAAGTSVVATTGQKAHVQGAWPSGVDAIVNDPARTDGWNPWFTEWPNDVNHYAFRFENADDINRLIKKLAAVESKLRAIHLSPAKELRHIGWVTSLPEGNGTAVVFSIGDQRRVNQWHARLAGRKFGVMTFKSVPVAVPPTLTIYVGNDAVDLDKLTIPDDIEVAMGDCAQVFYTWNTDIEAEQLKKKAREPNGYLKSLNESERKVADRIAKFLEGRRSSK